MQAMEEYSSFFFLFYDETIGTTGPDKVIALLDYLIKRLQNELGRDN